MFAAAAQALAVSPGQIAHVGDDPRTDVAGAAAAGFVTVWLNRNAREWPSELAPPDLEIAHVAELIEILD